MYTTDWAAAEEEKAKKEVSGTLSIGSRKNYKMKRETGTPPLFLSRMKGEDEVDSKCVCDAFLLTGNIDGITIFFHKIDTVK